MAALSSRLRKIRQRTKRAHKEALPKGGSTTQMRRTSRLGSLWYFSAKDLSESERRVRSPSEVLIDHSTRETEYTLYRTYDIFSTRIHSYQIISCLGDFPSESPYLHERKFTPRSRDYPAPFSTSARTFKFLLISSFPTIDE